MSLTLYSYPGGHRVHKALVAAQYVNVKIDMPAKFEMGKDNKSEEFLKMNPLGKVPVLSTPQGAIFESNAIARYVARLRPDAGLYGSSFFQSGQIDSWMDFSTTELEPARGAWIYPIYKYIAFNQKAYETAKSDVAKAMNVLNTHLLHNTYLVGNQVTIADIVIVCALHELYTKVMSAEFIAPYANVTRWFTTCVNQPQFAAVLGKVEFCKEETLAEGCKPAAKAAAPKAAAAPKVDLEAVAAAEEKAKPKSALESLPASPMSLDAVKRLCFLAKPMNANFFTEFWPMFDAQGWSFYECLYNYNSDNTVDFKTANAVTGFIQRSDATRKWAMGAMNMLTSSQDKYFHIEGCWLFRGQEVPLEMSSENPDAEYYTWKKIDVSTPEGKKKVEDYFMADSYNGKELVERKFFK